MVVIIVYQYLRRYLGGYFVVRISLRLTIATHSTLYKLNLMRRKLNLEKIEDVVLISLAWYLGTLLVPSTLTSCVKRFGLDGHILRTKLFHWQADSPISV